jgi:putative ABC transport system substrate-binding protein
MDRMGCLSRRELISLLSAAAAAPKVALAAPPGRIPRIGVLMGGAEHDLDWQRLEQAVEQELKRLGWVRSRDLRIDYRWPGDDAERIQAYATDLVETGPELIVAASTPAVQAVRRRTDTLPVVFVNAVDPVGNGLVASLAKPGGKTTGFAAPEYSIAEKWTGLVRELAPRTARIGIVFNPDTAVSARHFLRVLEAPAPPRGAKPVSIPFRNDGEVEKAIEEFAKTPNGALVVIPDSSTAVSRRSIIDTANKFKLPAVYPFRFFAYDNGLISYGADIVALCMSAMGYVDKILRGADAGGLPVVSADKFELIVNQRTAKALNMTVPPAVLARAAEIIE